MKINEVEQRVGISKKNIRFYEDQGLLHPGRNLTNGYRDYSEDDVVLLTKIKLLRRLSIPIEEIRRILDNKLTLSDCMERHQIFLNHELSNITYVQNVCRDIASQDVNFETIKAGEYLEKLDELEKGGLRFMNVKKTDVTGKKRVAALAAVVIILILGIYDGIMIVAGLSDHMPIGVMLMMVLPPTVVVAGIIIALRERFKEIDKGEDDEAANY